MGFPTIRPRRLRATPALRALVRETSLDPSRFVLPLFVHAGIDAPRPISTLPGVSQLPLSAVPAHAREAKARGLGGVILFGLPAKKDPEGRAGLDPNGPVPRAIGAASRSRRSTTTPRSRSSRRWRWSTPARAPTSWPRAT